MRNDSIKLKYIGKTYPIRDGYVATIIDYKNRENVTIELDDGTILTRRMDVIRMGQVENPNHRTVCGVGFTGQGEYKRSISGKHTQASRLWKGMLNRCYNLKNLSVNSTYKDCVVCEEWHNFQNFARWYELSYYEIDGELMHLDKDILVKGNKTYSPETCVFVPETINSLFTKRQRCRGELPIGVHYEKRRINKYISQCSSLGCKIYLGAYSTSEKAFESYKEFKEKEIKRIADSYKDKIPQKLYDAMYNYEVDITD